jgi:hypothetical protein
MRNKDPEKPPRAQVIDLRDAMRRRLEERPHKLVAELPTPEETISEAAAEGDSEALWEVLREWR